MKSLHDWLTQTLGRQSDFLQLDLGLGEQPETATA
jgi:hypothetical protein